MKNIFYLLVLFCIASATFTSCLSDECTDQLEYFRYDPVYMVAADFRIDINTESQKALENPGKMYYYNDILFINEQGEGVHLYDNSDNENPVFLTFYKIPGNFDIAIKNGLLVADNVIDMITVDISDIYNPEIVDRIEDYRERYSWVTDEVNQQYYAYSVPSPIKQVLDCSDTNFGQNAFWRGDRFFTGTFEGDFVTANESSGSGSSGTGIGGSSARFTIVGDYLYAVDHSSLLSFEFKNGNAPELKNSDNLGWGIETIFPYGDKLFIGSNSGMFIYGLGNPANPNKISTFEHARACDPVVVSGDRAYVTLRNGTECNGFTNQLDVIDISNLSDPTLIKSYSMKNPHGLAVDNDRLYLSEGTFGLKVIDVSNSSKIDELSWDKSISSTDVIYLGNNHLMSIGADGFHQYDVSDPDNIRKLSVIPVQ